MPIHKHRANTSCRVLASMIWSRPRIPRYGSRRLWPEGSSSTAVEQLEQIKGRVEAAVPGARLEIIPNESPSGQRSVLVDSAHAVAVARFLRDDPQLRLDYASNVTGVDWLDTLLKEKVKVKKL